MGVKTPSPYGTGAGGEGAHSRAIAYQARGNPVVPAQAGTSNLAGMQGMGQPRRSRAGGNLEPGRDARHGATPSFPRRREPRTGPIRQLRRNSRNAIALAIAGNCSESGVIGWPPRAFIPAAAGMTLSERRPPQLRTATIAAASCAASGAKCYNPTSGAPAGALPAARPYL